MEQNLYIPGDLVMFNNEVVMINEVDNAAGDENPFIYITCTNKRKSFYERSSEVNPIPLTPEILKKNGWKKEATHLSLKNVVSAYTLSDKEDFGYFPILLVEDYKGTFVVYPFTDGNICRPIAYIKYISDLQHLLFGLGLDSNIKL